MKVILREEGKKITDWSGCELDDNAVKTLKIGDWVRIRVGCDEAWEAIYVVIVSMNDLSFTGRTTMTYRESCASGWLNDCNGLRRFVPDGALVTFQSGHIREIPDWHGNDDNCIWKNRFTCKICENICYDAMLYHFDKSEDFCEECFSLMTFEKMNVSECTPEDEDFCEKCETCRRVGCDSCRLHDVNFEDGIFYANIENNLDFCSKCYPPSLTTLSERWENTPDFKKMDEALYQERINHFVNGTYEKYFDNTKISRVE